jgi:preprotein translocase subunit SecD
MIQVARWKIALVVLAVVFGIVFAAPNLIPQKALDRLPGWVPAKHVNLGLDLRGGAYLQLALDTQDLKHQRLVNLVEDIRNKLNDEQIAFTGPAMTPDAVIVTINDVTKLGDAQSKISALVRSPGATQEFSVGRQGTNQVVVTYRQEAVASEITEAIGRSIEVIRKRVDPDGNREISITREGVDRIVLQAPGDSDPERLRTLIGRAARLTFQMVDESTSVAQAQAGLLPPGTEIVQYDPAEAQGGESALVLKRRAVVTGEMLTKVFPTTDQKGAPALGFQFNAQGSRAFGAISSANIGKRFAIVWDGKIISAPVIRSAITGGSGIIEGNFTTEKVMEQIRLLKAGSLPAKLTVEDERATTAELGQDAINAGAISTAIGFVAIVVFMIGAYGFLFGGISVISLVLNLVLMVAILSANQAALTLPGIAGLILTLAVAVDANVLIYERIRDEERAGATPLMAMEHGFKRASVSILDANVTTLISAVIMFAIAGSGPVKGFAWTLAVGVITSVFTAMLVSQVLLGWWFKAAKPKQLPI